MAGKRLESVTMHLSSVVCSGQEIMTVMSRSVIQATGSKHRSTLGMKAGVLLNELGMVGL